MKSNKLFWVLAILLVALLGARQLYGTYLSADGVEVWQAQTLQSQGALLLDVREPDEYATVHVQAATLIPLGQLAVRLPEISAYQDKSIVVMCHSGRRSAKAVGLLREAGFSQVSNVSGGIVAWQKAGLPVVKQ